MTVRDSGFKCQIRNSLMMNALIKYAEQENLMAQNVEKRIELCGKAVPILPLRVKLVILRITFFQYVSND